MRTIVTLLILVTALACSRDETVRMTESTPSQSSNSPAPAPPPQTATEVTSAAGATQEVHLIEYAIHMPATLPAGKVSFNVENGGKEDHGFEIEGNGFHQKTNVLARGNTASLSVDLKPGTYTVYCPVKGHAEKGMKTEVVVK